jgi:hypothetical protein
MPIPKEVYMSDRMYPYKEINLICKFKYYFPHNCNKIFIFFIFTH